MQTVTLCPHSNGTHTECVGHALSGGVTLDDIGLDGDDFLGLATLLTVEPRRLADTADEYSDKGSPDDLVVW